MGWSWGVHADWEPILKARYDVYGIRFESEFKHWLEGLARSAAARIDHPQMSRLDADLQDLQLGRISGWRHFWSQWRKEPLISKVKSILQALATRQPPLELWAGEHEFDVANCFSRRVTGVFEVNRSKSKIAFIWFIGLPEAGSDD